MKSKKLMTGPRVSAQIIDKVIRIYKSDLYTKPEQSDSKFICLWITIRFLFYHRLDKTSEMNQLINSSVFHVPTTMPL